jgi:pimeloyl-ACP methyl ester carboxylesterase
MADEPALRSRFVDLEFGQVRVVVAGEGAPTLLIHHTPRSWRYYRTLMPILARDRLVIAFDIPGFGESDPLPRPATIHGYAKAAREMLDQMGIGTVDVCGAMTGACTAAALALDYRQAVGRLALLAMPMFRDDRDRQEHLRKLASARSGQAAADGAHLVAHWQMALQNWQWDTGSLGPEAFALASDFTADVMRAGDMWAEAANAAYSYGSADILRSLGVPTLVIQPDGPFPYPYLKMGAEVDALIPDSRLVPVPGTPITVTTTRAPELARILSGFFSGTF